MPRKARKTKKPKKQCVRWEDEHEPMSGDGIFDIIQPRNTYNNVSMRTINELGGYQITNMVLSRAPIRSYLRKAVDTVTFGRFEESLKKMGYDKVFHLSCVCDVEQDGVIRRVVIEKNAVVNVSTSYKQEKEAEYFKIQINRFITLKELLDKTQQRMGDSYFPYNSWSNNCQVFIDNILDANTLNTPEAHAWLFQDMTKVAEAIPTVSKNIMNTITHVGAVSDKLLGNGKGESSELKSIIRKIIRESL